MPTTRSMPAHRAADPPRPRSVLDDVMTSAETAEILGLRVSTVEDYARRGLLPSIKLGRHRRFLRSQVEQAIADMAGLR
jgi:excisionase family DNA binding protein